MRQYRIGDLFTGLSVFLHGFPGFLHGYQSEEEAFQAVFPNVAYTSKFV